VMNESKPQKDSYYQTAGLLFTHSVKWLSPGKALMLSHIAEPPSCQPGNR